MTPNGAGELVLTILREVGGSAVPAQDPINLGSGAAMGVRSADLDGDGLWDVGYGNAFNAQTLIYFNSTTASGSSMDPVIKDDDNWTRNLPDAWHMGQPGYADFDEDGDIDSLYPSNSAVRLHAGPILSPIDGSGSSSGSGAAPSGGFSNPVVHCADRSLDVTLCYPSLPTDHTGWKLHVAVWTRAERTASSARRPPSSCSTSPA